MENKTTSAYRTEKDMFALIETWKYSGISQQQFCRNHQLAYNIFQYWLRKYKKSVSQEPEGFAELKPVKKPFPHNIEIIFPSGARILVPFDSDPVFIKSLVN